MMTLAHTETNKKEKNIYIFFQGKYFQIWSACEAAFCLLWSCGRGPTWDSTLPCTGSITTRPEQSQLWRSRFKEWTDAWGHTMDTLCNSTVTWAPWDCLSLAWALASIVATAQTHTCVRVDDEEFRSGSLELVRDLGVWADVSVRGRDLQDEPAGGGVLWDSLTVQGLGGWGGGDGKKERSGSEYHKRKLHNEAERNDNTVIEKSRLYLLAYGAVVIGIQHFDLHNGFRSEDAITGCNVKEVIVLLFTVQGLPDRDLPFILNVFDGKLAEWVPSCSVLKTKQCTNSEWSTTHWKQTVVKKTQGKTAVC